MRNLKSMMLVAVLASRMNAPFALMRLEQFAEVRTPHHSGSAVRLPRAGQS